MKYIILILIFTNFYILGKLEKEIRTHDQDNMEHLEHELKLMMVCQKRSML